MDTSEADSRTEQDVNIFIRHQQDNSEDYDDMYDIDELVRDADEVCFSG